MVLAEVESIGIRLGGSELNLYAPTIARVVPLKLNTRAASRLRTLRKFAYVHLNSQTPCPARGAVPVNQGRYGSFFTLAPGSLSVMAATAPAMFQEFGTTAKAFKAFRWFVRSGEATGDHIGGTVPIRAQNCHHLPHLPVLRTGKAVLPGFHQRCCNSHFGRKMICGHTFLVELQLNPIRDAFHACGQRFRLRWFPCL